MKTKEEILSPIRGEGSFINSVDYDDALKAMDEYAQQFKHPVMKSDNDNYEPFGQEWKAEMKKWNKDLLIDFLRKNLIELNQFKQPVEPQAIDEALDEAAIKCGYKGFDSLLTHFEDGANKDLKQIIRNACAMTEGKLPTDEIIFDYTMKKYHNTTKGTGFIEGAKWMRDQLLPAPPKIDKEK